MPDPTIHARELLKAAINDLRPAVGELTEKTTPPVPMPRPRIFRVIQTATTTVEWPARTDTAIAWNQFAVNSCHTSSRVSWVGEPSTVINVIIEETTGRPKLMLRALRRIQAATAWCQARAEGRRRMAVEIARQQQRTTDILVAEAAMLALKS